MYVNIYLGGNQLTNIEGIQFIQAARLEQLSLNDNKIARCKTIIKTRFNLSLLDLSKLLLNQI